MDAALDSQAVLQKITDDGTFDKLRHQALHELRQHRRLREKAEALIRGCKAYQESQAQDLGKKKLFDAVRRELEERMLEEATAAMWEVVTQEQFGITQQVETAVHQALCRTSEQRQGEGQAAGGAMQQAAQQPGMPRFGA